MATAVNLVSCCQQLQSLGNMKIHPLALHDMPHAWTRMILLICWPITPPQLAQLKKPDLQSDESTYLHGVPCDFSWLLASQHCEPGVHGCAAKTHAIYSVGCEHAICQGHQFNLHFPVAWLLAAMCMLVAS